MKSTNPTYLTAREALEKAQQYCAYQERCQYDVRQKLKVWRVDNETAEWIISELILEEFINEARYAKAYASGKFRIKKWGRLKISAGLRQKQIGEMNIEAALNAIDEHAYFDQLIELISNKITSFGLPLSFEEEQKLIQQLYRKGYEPNLIKAKIKKHFNDKH